MGGGGGGARPASRKLAGVEWADLGVAGSRAAWAARTRSRGSTRASSALTPCSPRRESARGGNLRTGTVRASSSSPRAARARARAARRPPCAACGSRASEVLAADAVVLAMGPWTGAAARWGLPRACRRSTARSYHSVLMRPSRVLSQAVFFQGLGDPEVYPRPDGDVYVTGFPGSARARDEVPGEVAVRDDVCERLEDAMHAVSSELGEAAAAATTRQACHPSRPTASP